MTAADDMTRHAAAYCELIERSGELDAPGLLGKLHPVLARLYAAAIALPDAKPSEADYARHSFDELLSLQRDLQSRLAAVDHTREIFDPYGGDAELPVDVSLSDCLLGIYQDVHEGLAIAQAGAADDAGWTWKFSFEMHWGHHALDALRAIHAYRLSPGLHGDEWEAPVID